MSAPEPNLDPNDRRLALSALMDGDASASCEDACRSWRQEAATRADWHAWHLIGDVMRSDEHRADADHDARFLQRVREQLAREPVVMAPAPLVRPAAVDRSRRRWKAPAAVAAGFVAVAGVLVATRGPAPGSADGGMAAAGVAPANPVAATVAVTTSTAATSLPMAAEAAPMIRDAELDRYLAAHRQYGNGVPGGAVRQATVVAPGR